MEKIIDSSYDSEFREIEGLIWLPWVGKDYNKNKMRLLIVGESHYIDSNDITDYSASYRKVVQDSLFTRKCINVFAIDSEQRNKTFDNIHYFLLRSNKFKKEDLWKNISYYNFVQRVMNGTNERPNNHDFYDAWKQFVEVIKIIQPTECIFIGVTASNCFIEAMDELKIPENTFRKIPMKVNESYPRVATIIINNSKVKINFIRHCASYFSWSKWNDYLNRESPRLINQLRVFAEVDKNN